MLQFFKNRGYPDSVVKRAQERAQSTVSATNVTKGRESENTVHTHFSPTQPTCQEHHSEELQVTSE